MSAHLFVAGEFVSHAGALLPYKIDCDALADSDIACLAKVIAGRQAFGRVIGIPQGGLRLAKALEPYTSRGPILIVDDVLTTGASMEQERAKCRAHPQQEPCVGVVIFARGPCPPWIVPLFQATAARPSWLPADAEECPGPGAVGTVNATGKDKDNGY